jgi:hypothetical protein
MMVTFDATHRVVQPMATGFKAPSRTRQHIKAEVPTLHRSSLLLTHFAAAPISRASPITSLHLSLWVGANLPFSFMLER